MPDWPMSSFKNEHSEERAIEEALSEVSRLTQDMDRLDNLFDQFDEKTSNLNSRLEQLLSTERTVSSNVDQMTNGVNNLSILASPAPSQGSLPSDVDASTSRSYGLNNDDISSESSTSRSDQELSSLNQELSMLLGAASSSNPRADMASLGTQIESLSTQIYSFASRMDNMERILQQAGVVPEDYDESSAVDSSGDTERDVGEVERLPNERGDSSSENTERSESN
ncbi:uncharacterized protein LOC134847915 [Symsagittifera roscoffensis]|uniref:uncharacterized protein LOC134847915 n=1 Tax=Symsagittifera roscoffensis TaxID=84072 RepID=UPI00307B85DF